MPKCDTIPARRGLVWWKGTNGDSQIFFPTIAGKLIALQAETGHPVASFGENGKVVTGLATSAPIVHKNQLFVAVNSPAKVESYDTRTGKKYWSTNLIAGKQKLLGGAPWAGMSLDEKRGLLFVATGNPKPPFFGGNRPGKNLYTNSVVALDIRSGHIVWFWQEVEHGLWDYDIPSPPILTTVERDKHQVDVVVALTKIGNVIVLERSSGKPLFDYRLRRAPTSEVPGEKTAPYQPDLELPEPVGTSTFSLMDVTDISEKNRTSVIGQLDNATYGFFQPPVLGKTLISFGLHGGAEWPGGAVDHEKGVLFLTINNIPWKLRLSLVPTKDIQSPESRGKALYKANCESCHRPNRAGIVSVSGEKELEYVPSLVGASKIKVFSEKMQLSNWKERHLGLSKELRVTPKDLNEIFEYFRFVEKNPDKVIKLYELWTKLQPHNIGTHKELAEAYITARQLDKALQEYLIVLNMNPSDLDTLVDIKDIYIMKKNFSMAEEKLKQYAENYPDNYRSYFHLGQLYKEMGEFLKAKEQYEIASLIEPNFNEIKLKLALIESKLEIIT